MTDNLWTCLNKVTKDTAFIDFFNFAKKPLSSPANLKQLLSQIEKKLNNEFKISAEKFSAEANKSDEKDKIDLNKLTFDAFQRRLINLMLESIHTKQKEKSSLSDFLKKYWSGSSSEKVSRQIKIVKPSADCKNEESSQNDLASEDSENPLNNNIEDLNISEIQVQEHYRKSSSLGRLEINQAFEEFKKESEKNLDYLTVVRVGSPGFSKRNSLQDKGVHLVIDETNESDKSSRLKSPDFTLSKLDNTKEQIQEFSGLGSKIDTDSESLSDSETQKSSILEILNVKGNLNNQGQDKIYQGDIPSEISSLVKNKNPDISEIFEDSPDLNPWFGSLISGSEQKFKKIFKTFCGNGELIKVEDLGNLFLTTLKKLKIFPYDHYREMFRKVSEALYPARYASLSKKIVNPRINFNEFLETMNVWGERYQKEKKTAVGYTIKTSDFFRKIRESQNGELGLEVEKLVAGLSELISDYSNKDIEKQLPEVSKKNLEDIFQFYGKIQKIQGHEGTFEAVEASNSSWNLGKFLKFCSDFKISLNKQQENRGVAKENLIIIFKKFASNTRIMSFQQFLEALDSIAELIYSLENDKRFLTSFGYKTLNEKRNLLCEYLELNNFQKIQSKKQPFSNKHVKEANKQTGKLEIKPRARVSPRLIIDIEAHRHLPKMTSLKKPLAKVISPQPKLDPSKKLINLDGYSKRFRANFQQLKSEKLLTSADMKNEMPKTSRSPVLNERLTLSSLKSLSKNIVVDVDVRDLIINESYEVFDRFYQLNLSKLKKNN